MRSVCLALGLGLIASAAAHPSLDERLGLVSLSVNALTHIPLAECHVDCAKVTQPSVGFPHLNSKQKARIAQKSMATCASHCLAITKEEQAKLDAIEKKLKSKDDDAKHMVKSNKDVSEPHIPLTDCSVRCTRMTKHGNKGFAHLDVSLKEKILTKTRATCASECLAISKQEQTKLNKIKEDDTNKQ